MEPSFEVTVTVRSALSSVTVSAPVLVSTSATIFSVADDVVELALNAMEALVWVAIAAFDALSKEATLTVPAKAGMARAATATRDDHPRNERAETARGTRSARNVQPDQPSGENLPGGVASPPTGQRINSGVYSPIPRRKKNGIFPRAHDTAQSKAHKALDAAEMLEVISPGPARPGIGWREGLSSNLVRTEARRQ